MKRLGGGVIIQLFFFVVLPLALLLIVLSARSAVMHQTEMRDMIAQRDLTELKSIRQMLNSDVELRLIRLRIAADQLAVPGEQVLPMANHSFGDYEGGYQVLKDGKEIFSSSAWRINFPRGVEIAVPNAQSISASSKTVWIVLTGNSSDKRIRVRAVFKPETWVQSVMSNFGSANPHAQMYLLDSKVGDLLNPNSTTILSINHPGVGEAFAGKTGSVFMNKTGHEHVVAYTPLRNWALIMTDPWRAMLSSANSGFQSGLLMLGALSLISLTALGFGVRQIVLPLQSLGKKVALLAEGRYSPTEQSGEGIQEIRQLEAGFDQMAEKLVASQASLHQYVGAVTLAQEEERRHLARELHDETLQSVIGLKQRIHLLRAKVPDTQSRNALDEIQGLSEGMVQDLRRMMASLRPVYLEDLGLVPALKALTEQSGTENLSAEFRVEGEVQRLDGSVELALYRIAQEALSNVERHSNAQGVSVNLAFREGMVRLTITDDGKGFDTTSGQRDLVANRHFGLLGMSERATLIGATLELKSSSAGTIISVSKSLK